MHKRRGDLTPLDRFRVPVWLCGQTRSYVVCLSFFGRVPTYFITHATQEASRIFAQGEIGDAAVSSLQPKRRRSSPTNFWPMLCTRPLMYSPFSVSVASSPFWSASAFGA